MKQYSTCKINLNEQIDVQQAKWNTEIKAGTTNEENLNFFN